MNNYRTSLAFTLLLGALSALGPLSIDMGLAGIPLIERELSTEHGEASLTLSLFLAGFGLSPLISGALADRYGRKRILSLGLFAYTAASALCFFSPSFTALLVGRTLQGAAAGACVALPVAIVRDLLKGEAARVQISHLTAVVGISPLIAPLIGGGIIELFGWRAAHATQAGFGLALLVLVSLFLTESLAPSLRRKTGASQIISNCIKLTANPAFIYPSIIYASCFSVMFIYISGAPTIFIKELNFNTTEFSITVAISSGAVFFGSLFSAKLSKLGISEQRVLSIGCAAILLLIIATFLLHLASILNPATLISLMALTVFCFGVVSPTATHTAMLSIQESKGIATGLLRTLQMAISAFTSAALPALILVAPPLYAVLTLMAFCSLASIASCLSLSYARSKACLIDPDTSH